MFLTIAKKLSLLVIFSILFVVLLHSHSQKACAEDPVAQCQAEAGFCSTNAFCQANATSPYYFNNVDSNGNRLCGTGPTTPGCCAEQPLDQPGCNTNTVTACTNAFSHTQWNNSGSNVVCYQDLWQGNTGTL